MRRLRALVHEMGWRDASLHVAARALRAAGGHRAGLHKYYFVAQPIAAEPLLPPHRGRAIEVRRVRPGDAVVASFPRPPSVIAQRFESGALCFAAFKDEAFIGFLWLQHGTYLEDEVRCRFTPLPGERTVWDFDVYVDEAHRRGFAFARLWDVANAHCRASGVQWTVSRISAFNPGSLVSHAALGAVPLASACFVQAGPLQLMCSDLTPRLHLLLGPGREPELQLPVEPLPARRYARFQPR